MRTFTSTTPRRNIILFLAVNQPGVERFALDHEARAIQIELAHSGFRDSFELVTRWAAEPLDLLRELRKLRPTVIHFSGPCRRGITGEHRRGLEPSRGPLASVRPYQDTQGHGLYFQRADGRPQLVSTSALEETFGAAGSSVKLVVFSACYSEVQAEALLTHIDCVVGIGGSLRENAARNFAIGFYGGLSERESVAVAYKQGRAAISLEGLSHGETLQLRVRAGVDAAKLVFGCRRSPPPLPRTSATT